MSSSIRIGVLYGFRNPAASGLSFPAMYARVLQQIELVDQLGFDHVWITEHHFVEDGYMPSPLVMSGAIAARTSRVAIGQDVMLLPFTNPVRLAEDLVVLDNLSNGRMMVGAGMGYVPSEFAAMGIPRGERRQRMDETLEILRQRVHRGGVRLSRHAFPTATRAGTASPRATGRAAGVGRGHGRTRRTARRTIRRAPVAARRPSRGPRSVARRARATAGETPLTTESGSLAPSSSTTTLLRPRHRATASPSRRSPRVDRFRSSRCGSTRAGCRELSPADRMKTQLIEGNQDGTLIPQDAFIGSADACIAEALRMHDEYGITDIIVPGYSGAQPVEVVDANLVRLANEVLPALRGRLSSRGGNAPAHQKDHQP